MGYESRFYIVEKGSFGPEEDGLKWAEVIAMFDMCKVHCISNKVLGSFPKTDVYFYDGNIKVTKDCYGDPLTEIPIDEMIKILEAKNVRAELKDYRRYEPFLALLRSFDLSKWDNNIAVLHFGY